MYFRLTFKKFANHWYPEIPHDSLDELKLLAADTDPEISEMAKMELDEAQERYPVLEEELKILLLPKFES